jgi:hypothetical protein
VRLLREGGKSEGTDKGLVRHGDADEPFFF